MRFWPVFAALTILLVVLRLSLDHGPQGYGEARIGGSFALTDTLGRTVTDTDFRGKLMLVYMGYSHCPDICPMTLSVMGDALKNLGKDADKVAAMFISLDPERDTPQVLGRYLAAFDPRIIGLTGNKEAIDDVARAYAAYYKKVETPNAGAYLVDHSGFLYLMDRQGKYIAHYGPDVKAQDLARAIRANF
jgi:protein SCO1/2